MEKQQIFCCLLNAGGINRKCWPEMSEDRKFWGDGKQEDIFNN